MLPIQYDLVSACGPSKGILARVGDRWSVLIVIALRDGPQRFTTLKRILDGVSQRMLTLTLRQLRRDGLVDRTVTPTNPPRVDYELTELGHSLRRPVEELASWARDNAALIAVNHARFDRANVAELEDASC